jgi:hypothetical protein
MSADEVRELLRSRGCPDTVVAGGLEGLIADWTSFSHEIENGYALGLDDYLNDVDGRELIAAVVHAVPAALTPTLRRKLTAADNRARAALEPHPRCLWGDRMARSHGWEPATRWWYFTRPRRPGPELAEELGLT